MPGHRTLHDSIAPRLHIEWLSTHALKPNPRNARTHPKKQIKRLAENIRKFGFTNPLVVDDQGVIWGGHGRFEAAHSIGLTEVPVIRLGHLSPPQLRAFMISDNSIAERSGWDRELLARELGELIEIMPTEGLDISLTGFETAEIDLLLTDMAAKPVLAPEDVMPPIPAVITTRLGDLWKLGKHFLLCGDARQSRNFSLLMNGASAAAVITDPPYNVRVKDIGGRGKNKHREFSFAS